MRKAKKKYVIKKAQVGTNTSNQLNNLVDPSYGNYMNDKLGIAPTENVDVPNIPDVVSKRATLPQRANVLDPSNYPQQPEQPNNPGTRGPAIQQGQAKQGPQPWNLATRKLNPLVSGFNAAASATTAIANSVASNKASRNEFNQYLQFRQGNGYENKERYGNNNNPAYFQYGGKYQVGGQGTDGGLVYSDPAETNDYSGDILETLKAGGWIKGAINPAHKGYCTPMTKSTCTPRRKALARRFKSGDLHKGKLGGDVTEWDDLGWNSTYDDEDFAEKAQVGGTFDVAEQKVADRFTQMGYTVTKDASGQMKFTKNGITANPATSASNKATQAASQAATGNPQAPVSGSTPQTQVQATQAAGQFPTKDVLRKKYANNPYLNDQSRYNRGNQLNGEFLSGAGGNVKEAVYAAARQNNVDPALLYSSAMEEGMSGRLSEKNKDDVGADYNMKLSDTHPIDGFLNYGLDQFYDQRKALEKKGYLPAGFSSKVASYKTHNEKNEPVNAPAFQSDADALIAKSAMMRQSQDQLNEYTKGSGMKLTPKQQNFFLLANYNGGNGNMQKMLQSYQDKGYLKDDKFIDDVNFKPASYGSIYGNVQARLQTAKEINDEGYVKDFNQAPSQNSTVSQPQQAANTAMQYGGSSSDLYNNISNYEIDNNMIMQAGGIQQVAGLPNSMADRANVEAEKGEVYTDQQGNMQQVDPNGATHEQGGEMLPDVHRVLENTSRLRGDKVSKYLKLSPEQVQALTGLDTNKSMSHAEALIEGNANLEKQKGKLVKNIELAGKGKNHLDKYAENSTKLNVDHFQAIPSKEELFNRLFDHQEMTKAALGINNDGSSGEEMKYGGKKFILKAQTGLTAYPGNTTGQKTPAGNSDAFPADTTLEDYVGQLKKAGVNVANVKNNSDLQSAAYSYALKNNPDAIRQMWQEGIHNQGYDKAIKAGLVYDKDDTTKGIKRGQFKEGVLDDPANLQKLAELYPDSNLGPRLIKLATGPRMWTDNDIPPQQPTPRDNTQVQATPIVNNLRRTPQAKSNFNEPLKWYDLASPIGAYVAGSERLGEKYNPTKVNQLQLHQLDPTAALNANEADFSAAVKAVQETAPNNIGAQLANISNLTSRKYALNNQVIGNYENQNVGIKNQEIQYNTQARDRQSQSDQQSREAFEDKVLTGKAKQQEQKLTALDSLYKTVAENAALNRNGDLIMKMSKAFDQYGNYNGYTPTFTANTPMQPNQYQQPSKFQPAGGVQGLTPGKSYYNRRTGKTLRFDGTSLVEVK